MIFNEYYAKEKDVVTGIVQRNMGRNYSINLGKADAILTENEQVKTEVFKPTERIKVYILEVKDTPKGPKILVSRTHPELVKRLFEAEVTEVKDGTVEIKSIAKRSRFQDQDRSMEQRPGCGSGRSLRRYERCQSQLYCRRTPGRKDRHYQLE